MSVDHYENFPVASLLCPPAFRPAVAAIYWYARTADDIADEGDASPEERLRTLAGYRLDLERVIRRQPPSLRWGKVFEPLARAIASHALPVEPLRDLLDAFEQDVTQHRYADRHELLAYCRRSANPVGRLLLHLYGVADERSFTQSDAICSALQLANFWQDLGLDTRRGRLYIPASDMARHGVPATSLMQGESSASARALIGDLVDWTRELMHAGAGLVHRVPGRAGWELRLVVQGGLRILEKIEDANFEVLMHRPRLRWSDAPLLAARAIAMRREERSLWSRTT